MSQTITGAPPPGAPAPVAPAGNSPAGGAGNGHDDQHDPPDRRWFWLTAFQYVLIATVTLLFVFALVWGLKDVRSLADMDTARGLITFVIAVGTVAIAIMLSLTAVVTRDFDKRIAVGKEILALLIGVLGTIVGFYYGAAASKKTETAPLTIAAPKLTQSNGNVSLTTTITGGTKPYEYSIKFVPDSIPALTDLKSEDGEISLQFKQPTPPLTQVSITIEGKDKDGKDFVFNKDGKIKTAIPAPVPAPTPTPTP